MRNAIRMGVAVLILLAACKPQADVLDRPLPEDRAQQEALAKTLPQSQRGLYKLYLDEVRRTEGTAPQGRITLREAINAGAARNRRQAAELRDEKENLYGLQRLTAQRACDARPVAQRPQCVAEQNRLLEHQGVPPAYLLQ